MYLNHTRDGKYFISKKVVSNLSMKRHAYGGPNLVPIAVSETCCLILLLNLKNLFFNTNSTILTKSPVEINFLSCLSQTSLRALKPALWGMLGYNFTTSAVNKIALSSMVPSMVLFVKSAEPLIYNQSICMIGLKWRSIKLLVGLPQLEIFGLPEHFEVFYGS